ncbi:MoeA, N-terminal and linker domain-containing protein [Schizophyllum amplum]|uniref:MoeA, N-terminal and linker domain-containing protein n=1 Tax=Schizophyllum amplum TaxID=97359 RepID=A0A550CSP6_9AGAR|nr:MoeA, N-terminal and linker domain-containing protein [Auriculariopsis ampla]
MAWVSRGDVDWIITTGGTGFGVRDTTPEAVKPLIEREAPGLVHLMLSTSLQATPMAALARPVAGTIRNTLVLTLPGSVKAVKEVMSALLSAGVISHALSLIQGGSGADVHSALARSGVTDTSVAGSDSSVTTTHHHHHHHHRRRHHHHDHAHGDHRAPQPRSVLAHDPSAPVSTRHRTSPYPLISFDEAMKIIFSNLEPLPVQKLPVNAALRGHVLAEDIYAPNNAPPTSTTSVDGYAMRSSDPPGIYKVVTPKTHKLWDTLPAGYIYRINTGAPLPKGTDTVIMVEDTRLVSAYSSADAGELGEEKEVETLAQIPVGENVRMPGSDVKEGAVIMKKGDRILSSGGEIGTLAFVGRKTAEVYKRPVVAILSTGNEVLDLQKPEPPRGEGWVYIYDTNRPSLQAALEGLGYEVIDLGIVTDEVDSHVNALRQGLERADIILTTGGTSMSAEDLLKPVIERNFDGTVHFGRVTIKPGKPTTFATIPMPNGAPKPVFALPGNPASALVTFYIFVLPALRRLAGWPEELCQLPRVPVLLQDAMRLDPRTEFHRAIIKASPRGLVAFSTGSQRSSRIASLSGANGFVVVPPKTAMSPAQLEIGAMGEAVIIGEIQMA